MSSELRGDDQVNKKAVSSWIALNKEKMGFQLNHMLATTHINLASEIAYALHEDKKTYKQVVESFFDNPDGQVQDFLHHPIIESFKETDLCSDEEKAFFETNMSIEDFREWLNTRMPVLMDGLKHCVLYGGMIEPVSAKTNLDKRIASIENWRQEKPEEYAAQLKTFMEAGRAAIEPHIFTPEIRAIMQKHFDRGQTYQEVAEILGYLGIETTPKALKGVVEYYDDLSYTTTEIKERRLQKMREGVLAVFERCRSRSEAIEILTKFGITDRQVRSVLEENNARKRVDWNKKFIVDGETYNLNDLLVLYVRNSNHEFIKDEYKGFIDYLTQIGISDSRITENSYYTKRATLFS